MKRTIILNAILQALDSKYPNEFDSNDFTLDYMYRSLNDLPVRSPGKEPYYDVLVDDTQQN
ncbi:MAG: hypothetical protein AB4368_14120 [Xenococcaceae cyanobacterium]